MTQACTQCILLLSFTLFNVIYSQRGYSYERPFDAFTEEPSTEGRNISTQTDQHSLPNESTSLTSKQTIGDECGAVPVYKSKEFRLQSPRFPAPYPPRLLCLYIVEAVSTNICLLEVNFLNFDLGDCGSGDHVVLAGQNLCGNIKGVQTFRFSPPRSLIQFRTRTTDGNRRGFDIVIRQIQCPYVSPPNPECSGMFSGRNVVLRSPAYPSPYPNNVRCQYSIRAINTAPSQRSLCRVDMNFEMFDIENSEDCRKDRLEIGDQDLLCGSINGIRTYQYVGELRLNFLSDGNENGRGFRITAVQQDCRILNVLPQPPSVLPPQPPPILPPQPPISPPILPPYPPPILPPQPPISPPILPPYLPPISPPQPPISPPILPPYLPPISPPQPPISPPSYLPLCCNRIYNGRHFFLVSPGFPFSNSNEQTDCLYEIHSFSANVCRLRIIFKLFWVGQEDNYARCFGGFLEIDGLRYCDCHAGLTITASIGEQWNGNRKIIRYRKDANSRSPDAFILEVFQEECPGWSTRKRHEDDLTLNNKFEAQRKQYYYNTPQSDNFNVTSYQNATKYFDHGGQQNYNIPHTYNYYDFDKRNVSLTVYNESAPLKKMSGNNQIFVHSFPYTHNSPARKSNMYSIIPNICDDKGNCCFHQALQGSISLFNKSAQPNEASDKQNSLSSTSNDNLHHVLHGEERYDVTSENSSLTSYKRNYLNNGSVTVDKKYNPDLNITYKNIPAVKRNISNDGSVHENNARHACNCAPNKPDLGENNIPSSFKENFLQNNLSTYSNSTLILNKLEDISNETSVNALKSLNKYSSNNSSSRDRRNIVLPHISSISSKWSPQLVPTDVASAKLWSPVGSSCRVWGFAQWLLQAKQYFWNLVPQILCPIRHKPRPPSSISRRQILKQERGWFQSPGYPVYYPNNLRFSYRFLRLSGYCQIRLSIVDFSLEDSENCSKDYLLFGGQWRYCSESLLSTGTVLDMSRSPYMDLVFVSDGYYSGRGFRAFYQHVPCSRRVETTTNPSPECGQMTNQQYFILTRSGYTEQSSCIYRIQHNNADICSLRLTFSTFNLACDQEYLQIDNQVFCGHLSGRSIELDFFNTEMRIVYQRIGPKGEGEFVIEGRQIQDCVPGLSEVPLAARTSNSSKQCDIQLSDVRGNVVFPKSHLWSSQFESCDYIIQPHEGMCHVRLDFLDFYLPSTDNCTLAFFELQGKKFCNFQLERGTSAWGPLSGLRENNPSRARRL